MSQTVMTCFGLYGSYWRQIFVMGLSNMLVLVLSLSLTFMIIIIKVSYKALSLDNLWRRN